MQAESMDSNHCSCAATEQLTQRVSELQVEDFQNQNMVLQNQLNQLLMPTNTQAKPPIAGQNGSARARPMQPKVDRPSARDCMAADQVLAANAVSTGTAGGNDHAPGAPVSAIDDEHQSLRNAGAAQLELEHTEQENLAHSVSSYHASNHTVRCNPLNLQPGMPVCMILCWFAPSGSTKQLAGHLQAARASCASHQVPLRSSYHLLLPPAKGSPLPASCRVKGFIILEVFQAEDNCK